MVERKSAAPPENLTVELVGLVDARADRASELVRLPVRPCCELVGEVMVDDSLEWTSQVGCMAHPALTHGIKAVRGGGEGARQGPPGLL